jgi:predicted thioesterase
VVHPVCSTFALARDIEWSTRLFVLDMREDDEEGIGTFLSVEHKSPAFVNEKLTIEATVEHITGHELICSYIARVGERIVATGKTGQKILKREKIARLFHR